MRKNIISLLMLVILSSSITFVSAQDNSSVSKFSITAHANVGHRVGLFMDDNLFGAVEVGIGGKYHFCDHWSLNFGLDYMFCGNGLQRKQLFLQMPIQLEYQLEHFYVNGGFYVLPGFDYSSVGNVDVICSIGASLGVGGRITLTQRDCMTIGAQVLQNIDIENIKPMRLSDFSETVMLKIGYEHRF